MDYEKKYKEALETARKINNGEGVAGPPDWTTYEVIFPELKESEDEKIRKALLEYFGGFYSGSAISNNVVVEDVLAWLEKQGQTFSTLSNSSNTEKKWTEEDEDMFKHCIGAISIVGYIVNSGYTPKDKEEMKLWLNSLKQRMEQ